MTTQDLYNQYPIPKNLQTHMLRAAALAQIIVENWTGPNIDKDSIIKACLFHDAGKLVKFDLSQTNMFEEGDHNIDYWRERQKVMVEKYGPLEHPATHGVVTDMGLPKNTIALIEKMGWRGIDKHLNNKDFDACIAIYCDMRISPFGILSLNERITNLQARRPNENFSVKNLSGNQLEQALQQQVSLNLGGITEADLVPRFSDLLLLN